MIMKKTGQFEQLDIFELTSSPTANNSTHSKNKDIKKNIKSLLEITTLNPYPTIPTQNPYSKAIKHVRYTFQWEDMYRSTPQLTDACRWTAGVRAPSYLLYVQYRLKTRSQ